MLAPPPSLPTQTTCQLAGEADGWALFGDEVDNRASAADKTTVSDGVGDNAWVLFDEGNADPPQAVTSPAETLLKGSAQEVTKSESLELSNTRLAVVQARAQLVALAAETVPAAAIDLATLGSPWSEAAPRLSRALSLLRESRDTELLHVAQSLADEAFAQLTGARAWHHPAQRELFCISGAMAAVAACTNSLNSGLEPLRARATLLRAMKDADLSTILGLPAKVAGPLCRATESVLRVSGILDGSSVSVSHESRDSSQASQSWPAVGVMPAMIGPAVHSVAAAALPFEEFQRRNFRHSAVVLRGYANSWPGCSEWAGAAGLRRLAQRHGHRTVPVELCKVGGEMREELMLLRNFVEEHLLAPDAGPRAASGETAYLAQHDLFAQIPELRSFISTPEYCRAGTLSNVSAWLGTGGTVTRAHYDSYDNLFVQLTGRKYVRLLDQDQADCLYRVKRARGEDDSGASHQNRGNYEASLLAQGNVSAIPDLEHVDLEKYPKMAHARYSETILEAGEWHFVRSLSTSFSVNFWF